MKRFLLLLSFFLIGCQDDSNHPVGGSSGNSTIIAVNPAEKNYIYHRYVGPDVVQEAKYPEGVREIHSQSISNDLTNHTIQTFTENGWLESTKSYREGEDTTLFVYSYEFDGDFLTKSVLTVNGTPNVSFDYSYNSEGFLVEEIMTSLISDSPNNFITNLYRYEERGDTIVCTQNNQGSDFRIYYAVDDRLVREEIISTGYYTIFNDYYHTKSEYDADGTLRVQITYNEYGEVFKEYRGGSETVTTYTFRDSNDAWTLCETSNGGFTQRQISYY